jgi:preprotein translocase subunit YajC
LLTVLPTLAQATAPTIEPTAPAPPDGGLPPAASDSGTITNVTTATTQPGTPGAAAAKEPPPWWTSQFIPLLLIVAVFYFFLFRSKKNTEKKRTEMLNQLKRGDRVQTIGGILGTVVEAKEHDVLLKVDESSNTKIRFSRSAIHRVLEDDGKAVAVNK